MKNPFLSVLVVDDYEPFRRAVRLILQLRADLQIVGEASDGLEAIRKSKELLPDLILLDIDLPKLNGIQAARRLRDLIPGAKILFLSVESSPDVIRQALQSGGAAYVQKLNAYNELLPALEAILSGKQFVSGTVTGQLGQAAPEADPHHHEMLIYSSERILLESFSCFIEGAVAARMPVIVVATESQLNSLHQSLDAGGVDVAAATESGTFTSFEVRQKLSKFMVNDLFDPVRFVNSATNVITTAAKVAGGTPPRIALCGIAAPVLWAEGRTEAALRLEQLWDHLAKAHAVDSLCAYPSDGFAQEKCEHTFGAICAQHTAVYSR